MTQPDKIMPSDEDFMRIEALSRQVVGTPGGAYGIWLAARGAGLKVQAKAALAAFLEEALIWPDQKQRDFAAWLDMVSTALDDRAAATPHPLMTQLILPTLRNWADTDPRAAMPHLLLGRFHSWLLDPEPPLDHFRRALKRNPDLVLARRGVIQALCDAVERNQHHLPDSYLGDRAQDAASMDEVAAMARNLPDPSEAEGWARHAAMLRDRALRHRDDGGIAAYGFPR
jgi:hypothetical protein